MAEPQSDVASKEIDQNGAHSTPTLVVERFLDLLRLGKVDEAVELLDADVRYENVGLPTIHGRERVRRLFQGMWRGGGGFDVHINTISADGPSVMTERVDVLKFRQLHIQLWVCGRFDVRNQQIVLWRDYFDYLNFAMAMVRGMLAIRLPMLRAKLPSAS
jgi:limonene-1,2-epoxide hydrolase